MHKLFTVTILAAQLVCASAFGECIVRVTPSFSGSPAAAVLRAKEYKLVTALDAEDTPYPRIYLAQVVKDGEFGIVSGSLWQGGFEFWKREKDQYSLIATQWSYTESSESVIKRALPSCSEVEGRK